MSDSRRWYTEPETFIAVAALVVSISAVVVGIYEASLQRHHDRAEVWPNLEIGVFTTPSTATIKLQSTGVGPAIIKSVVVTVDGKAKRNWDDVLRALTGREPTGFGNYSSVNHGMRPGDELDMLIAPTRAVPADFWTAIKRVSMTVCYGSVFEENWIIESKQLGVGSTWRPVDHCPKQADSTFF